MIYGLQFYSYINQDTIWGGVQLRNEISDPFNDIARGPVNDLAGEIKYCIMRTEICPGLFVG